MARKRPSDYAVAWEMLVHETRKLTGTQLRIEMLRKRFGELVDADSRYFDNRGSFCEDLIDACLDLVKRDIPGVTKRLDDELRSAIAYDIMVGSAQREGLHLGAALHQSLDTLSRETGIPLADLRHFYKQVALDLVDRVLAG